MMLTGGQIIARYLQAEGVPYVIGIPGHGILGLVDAFREEQFGAELLQPRTETAGVYLADGYYRMTGKPLAVFTSIGPGAINTAIGVATCYVDSTAVLVLTGDTHTHMMGKGVLQEIERSHDSDFSRLTAPITKRYWRATQVDQLPSILHRAFNEMLSGRPGPVVISLPMNVQCDAAEVELGQPQRYRSSVVPGPDAHAVGNAAKLLASASRPVILAGGGVNLSRAFDELRDVAEFLGAAVVTTLQGKGCFPGDHTLAGWLTGSKGTSCGLELVSRADAILAVGCRFADETTCSYRRGFGFNVPPTKLIQIDIDPQEIGKNYPVEVGIVSDAKAALAGLLAALQADHVRCNLAESDYVKEITRLREDWLEKVVAWTDDRRRPMMISSLLRELRSFLDRDAIVASSSGNTQAQILQEFPFYEPLTNLTTGGFSTMGWAVPAAMGAKLALPHRQVVAVVGDGDFSMTMGELATACQYNIPVVIVIANNCGWISIKDLQQSAFGEDRAYHTDFIGSTGELYSPDFARLAKSFGAYGKRIEQTCQVSPALREAFESGTPAVIEAVCCREYPHSGSPAVGWWDVPVPTYLTDRRKDYEQARAEEVLE